MTKVDMSAKAVTTRLKRVSQLRRLGLALQKAKIQGQKAFEKPTPKGTESVKRIDPKTR